MTISSSTNPICLDFLKRSEWATKSNKRIKNHYESLFIAHYEVNDANPVVSIHNRPLFARSLWSYGRYYFRAGSKKRRFSRSSFHLITHCCPHTYIKLCGKESYKALTEIASTNQFLPKNFVDTFHKISVDNSAKPTMFYGVDFLESEKNDWVTEETLEYISHVNSIQQQRKR